MAMKSIRPIAMGAVFAAALFAASAVNAATFEEQLSLSDGGSGGASAGSGPAGPAGRRADSGSGISSELQAQLSLTDGGPAPSADSYGGPQGRSAEGGGSGIDEHLEAQLKVSDGTR